MRREAVYPGGSCCPRQSPRRGPWRRKAAGPSLPPAPRWAGPHGWPAGEGRVSGLLTQIPPAVLHQPLLYPRKWSQESIEDQTTHNWVRGVCAQDSLGPLVTAAVPG